MAQTPCSSERETATGAIESRQWIELPRGAVSADEEGARRLGERYLEEVRRTTRGIVRSRSSLAGTELVLGGMFALLRFGPAELAVRGDRVECRYPISGGLLAARPGGSLVIVQRSTATLELELVVAGYFPRLGGSRRRRSVRRAVYSALQARVHRAVSRRFLERAAGGALS